MRKLLNSKKKDRENVKSGFCKLSNHWFLSRSCLRDSEACDAPMHRNSASRAPALSVSLEGDTTSSPDVIAARTGPDAMRARARSIGSCWPGICGCAYACRTHIWLWENTHENFRLFGRCCYYHPHLIEASFYISGCCDNYAYVRIIK